MSLFEAELADARDWTRVGACYEVTRKPRGLDRSQVPSIPFAAMEAIPRGGGYAPTYTMRTPDAISSGTYFERGDILVAKITPSFENGKQALAFDLPGAFGYATTEVIPLHPVNRQHDPRFLFFYLLHPDVRHYVAERMEGSTGRQRVAESVLLDLPIPAFDRKGQSTIASALEAIQLATAADNQCEQIVRELKRVTMYALFTRGLRSEAKKATEIGVLPANWQVCAIGKLARQMQYGLSVRGEPTGKYPILRMNCQRDGKVVLRDLQYVDLDDKRANAYRIRSGDILFNRTNSYELVGRTAIAEGEIDAVFASYLVRVSIDKDQLDPRFLNHYMNWEKTQSDLKKLASRGVSQANISASKLREFVIPVPDLDEQQEIVTVLDALDRKIDLHRRKCSVLDDLFKTLLHKLLIGEINVADLDLSALDLTGKAEDAA